MSRWDHNLGHDRGRRPHWSRNRNTGSPHLAAESLPDHPDRSPLHEDFQSDGGYHSDGRKASHSRSATYNMTRHASLNPQARPYNDNRRASAHSGSLTPGWGPPGSPYYPSSPLALPQTGLPPQTGLSPQMATLPIGEGRPRKGSTLSSSHEPRHSSQSRSVSHASSHHTMQTVDTEVPANRHLPRNITPGQLGLILPHDDPSSTRPTPSSTERLDPTSSERPRSSMGPVSTSSHLHSGPSQSSHVGNEPEILEDKPAPPRGGVIHNGVPTWRPNFGPPPVKAGMYSQRPIANKPSNSTTVERPRQWGNPDSSSPAKDRGLLPQAPASARPEDKGHESDDGGWGAAPEVRLRNWVNEVAPAPPPPPDVASSPVPEDVASHISSPVMRPSSAREKPDPVTIFYSDDEKEESVVPKGHNKDIAMNDVKKHVDDAAAPTEIKRQSTATTQVPPEPPIIPTVDILKRPSSRHSFVSSHFTDPTTGLRSEFDRTRFYREEWWKDPTHPAYSPMWASRRVNVRIQFPVRLYLIRDLMFDHFSRWGTVRCVFPIDVDKRQDQCDKALVVFEDEQSVINMMNDDTRIECVSRNPSRCGESRFLLDIRRLPAEAQLRTIYVEVSGPRHDARSRSASPRLPSPHDDDPDDKPLFARNASPLPPSITVWGLPVRKKGGMFNGRVVLEGPQGFFNRRHIGPFMEVKNDEGREPVKLQVFDLGRRTLERDFLPAIVDYYCDIHRMVPPGAHSPGWVFSVWGPRQAIYLLETLSCIPGITARWARSSDAVLSEPPLSAEQAAAIPLPDDPVDRTIVSPATRPTSVKSEAEATASPGGPCRGSPALPCAAVSLPPDPAYPHLSRQLTFTYRGRLVRQEMTNGEPRYIDDAAIFVGRLVKEQESQYSLLERFSRYGSINSVEYNPRVAKSTYATARILFKEADSARRAMQFENGAISFGSCIKVEPRKVLPMEVQVREMYIDHLGRAISPSMVSQYSPPLPTTTPPAGPASPFQQPASFSLPPPWSHGPQAMPFNPPGWIPNPMPWLAPSSTPIPTNGDNTTIQPTNFGPMAWSYSVGYYLGPMPAPAPPPPAPLTSVAPSSMSPKTARRISIGPVTGPAPPAPLQTIPAEPTSAPTVQMPSSASRTTVVPQTTGPSAPAPATDKDGPSSSSNPRYLGAKMEEGLFKPIYDEVELKHWRETNNIQEPKSPQQPPPAESLPLLPLHTGGHDPAPAGPTVSRTSSTSGSARPPLTPMEGFQDSFSRNQFFDPNGNFDSLGGPLSPPPRQYALNAGQYGPPGTFPRRRTNPRGFNTNQPNQPNVPNISNSHNRNSQDDDNRVRDSRHRDNRDTDNRPRQNRDRDNSDRDNRNAHVPAPPNKHNSRGRNDGRGARVDEDRGAARTETHQQEVQPNSPTGSNQDSAGGW